MYVENVASKMFGNKMLKIIWKYWAGFQAFIYDITQHLYFKRAIAVLVLFNSFLLCVKWEEDIDNDDDDNNNNSNSNNDNYTMNAATGRSFNNNSLEQVCKSSFSITVTEKIQSNLWRTTSLGTPKFVAVIDRLLLFGGCLLLLKLK